MGWFSSDEEPAAASASGHRYLVAGRPVRCAHCAGEEFVGQEVPLASRSAALLNVEWAAAGAYAMTCTACRAIQWFAVSPERVTS